VVLDAVFAEEGERRAGVELARRHRAHFAGVWLEAPPGVLTARVDARRGDASDATAEVVARQLRYDLGRIDWKRVDASGTPEDTLGRVRGTLPFRAAAPA
jgi:predicted kinase